MSDPRKLIYISKESHYVAKLQAAKYNITLRAYIEALVQQNTKYNPPENKIASVKEGDKV